MEEDAKRIGPKISAFSSLPEGCIANILSLTSPKDACRAAAVSLGFKSAAESDTVWERFLPRDYDEIISQSDSPVTYSTKKDLYFLLCDSGLLLNRGKLSFSLSKSTGKKCYMLCARELAIAWADDLRYWTWTFLPESRFAEVAVLRLVWWFDIRGTLASDVLSPNTSYAAYLVFKLADGHDGLVHRPLKTTVKCVGEEDNFGIAYIVPPGDNDIHLPERGARASRSRTDGWMEIELGELFVPGQHRFDVESRLVQCAGPAKRGLILEGIEVRPKSDSNPASNSAPLTYMNSKV